MTLTIPTCPAQTFNNTSFDPDKRAASYTAELHDRLAQIDSFAVECGLEQNKLNTALLNGLKTSHIAVTRAYWAALANCASPVITGPANFPVARARKARDRADRHSQTVSQHLARCLGKIERIAFPFGRDGDPIRANDPDAIEKLEAKLADLKTSHDQMKQGNALLRRVKDAEALKSELENLGLSAELVARVLAEKARTGSAQFFLSNSLARIKATEDRLIRLKNSKAKESDEQVISGVRVIRNREEQRLQLVFPDKPSPAIIGLLKRHAFKWSPLNTAWQRVLTNNAVYAAREVLRSVGGD
jgi:hypothetical protein